ncbi:MAG: MBL fold metallo-hydrolase [Clostridia bacterium]|nr:MBL fold metallo-hydrolase [Clostridia bacterium]
MKKRMMLPVLALMLGLMTACTENTAVPDAPETDRPAETSGTVSGLYGKEDREILDLWQTVVPSGEHEARILYLTAGKADSILVMIDDAVCLNDTGISASPARLIPAMEQVGAQKIDHLVLTHTHNDHIGGYEYLSEVFEIGTVHTSSISMNLGLLDNLTAGKEHLYHDPGDVIPLTEGVWLEVLGPIEYNSADDNDNSLVLRLNVNGVVTVFAADMKYAEEATLMENGLIGDCDVLKVGHQGYDDTASAEFLAIAQPEYAVISTDREEEKDSAHENVIARLESAGSEVFVTDEYGLGLLCEIDPDGEITWTELEPAGAPVKVKIESVSKSEQLLTLKNKSGRDADLSGWLIYSDRGHEYFVFPEGAVIPSGGTVTVGCRDYDGTPDYEWAVSEAWHGSKKDKAFLYDSFGNLIDDKKSE